MLSTSASENQTLRLLVDDDVAGGAQADNNAMDVDIPAGEDGEDGEMSSPLSEASSDVEVTTSAKPVDKQKNTPPLRNIVHAPDGTIIVETLDTPALRRQKTMRRRAERLQRAAEAEASASAGPSQIHASGSGSSSLTDLDGDEEDGKNQSKVAAPTPPPPKDPAVVVLAEGETLEGGTLGTW